MKNLHICIVTLNGANLLSHVDMPATKESIDHIIEAIRICYVVMTNKATGVYFCIEHDDKPKEIRFFRFLGGQAIEEEIENELWVRNVMFQNRQLDTKE